MLVPSRNVMPSWTPRCWARSSSRSQTPRWAQRMKVCAARDQGPSSVGMARHLAPFACRQTMAEIVRRRSWGGVLPLGRHVSISGSSLIQCASVSMAPPHPGWAKCYPGAKVQGRTGPSLARDESKDGREDTPRDHDASDPQSGAHFFQDDVRRHFKEKIAYEEDARAEAEHRGREPEILVHRQRREADVDAVNICDKVEEHDERHDAPRDLAQRPLFQIIGH